MESPNIVNYELVFGSRNGLLLTDMRLDERLVYGCVPGGIPSAFVMVLRVRETFFFFFAQESIAGRTMGLLDLF